MNAEIQTPPAAPRLIRKGEVKVKTGFKSDSGLYEAIARGDFPAQIKIGPRASAWIESEVDGWIAAKIAAARGKSNAAA